MSTKNNTLFDISCPDPVLRSQVFDELSALDILQAHPIPSTYKDMRWNNFLQYSQGHYTVLEAMNWIKVSSNPINVSNGLLSEFFIIAEALDQKLGGSAAKDAYRHLRDKILQKIDVVHIHIRSMPGNDVRRMSLSALHQTVDIANPNEQWLTFETPDIDAISKQIIKRMR